MVESGVIILVFVIGILQPGCFYSPIYPPSSRKLEIGLASWYGSKFHGLPTASGEIYNMYDITAAHKILPLGTWVMVTNLSNGKSLKLKINDRGPFVKDRIIDLSYAAARILDMVDEGVVKVRLEVLKIGKGKSISSSSPSFHYTIQVGSFIAKKNAENLVKNLEETFPEVYITVFSTSGNKYYQVKIGKFPTNDSAFKTARKLAQKGLSVFIVGAE